MGALDDPAVRAEALKLGGQIATLALESIRGRKLKATERDALLAAVRRVQAERVFTPTDEILGRDDGETAKNADADGTPDEAA